MSFQILDAETIEDEQREDAGRDIEEEDIVTKGTDPLENTVISQSEDRGISPPEHGGISLPGRVDSDPEGVACI